MKKAIRWCGDCHADREFEIYGGTESAELRESSHAVLRGSSHAELRGSSHAELWGSSHAVLRDSSHAELWGSSHAVLRDSSHAVLRESSSAVLSQFAVAHIHGKKVKCKGGVRIKIPEIATAKEWCDYYGVKIKRDIAVLFKGVDDDYSTDKARARQIFYKPGETPQAPDWDGGVAECGGGLHFSPTVAHTRLFNPKAKHFIACPIKVSQIKVHKNAQYPDKVKAPGLCAPCYEVDRYGKRIEGKS